MHTTSLTASSFCAPLPRGLVGHSLAFCLVTIEHDFGLLVDELPLLWVWQVVNRSKPASMSGYLVSPAPPAVVLQGIGTCAAPVVLWGSAW